VGNQPHSEIAALAIFLDRLFRGRQLGTEFAGGSLKIVPSERGKVVHELK
jgi:tRNA (cytidine56-2'-O)-methyltransferase